MVDIGLNNKEGQKKVGRKEFVANRVDAALTEIDGDLAALPTATTAELKLILQRCIQRQRKIIRYVGSLD